MPDLMALQNGASALNNTIQVSVRGRWVDAPSLRVNGQTLVVRGKSIRIASLHDEDWIEEEIADPPACIRALKDKSSPIRADIFAFTQREPEVAPRYPYPMELRSMAVAAVGDYNEWLSKLSTSTRKNIRQAEKRGVVLKVRGFDTDVIQGICEVQNETPIRQGRPYPHYGKSFEQARRDHGSFVEHSDFVCAYFEGEFIGFLKLVYRGETATILQMMSKVAHYERRTANALLGKAAELCAQKGVKYLTYGLFNYGNRGDTSLREFKVRHGFGEMLVPRYFVPLTAWGHICVKTKLYRGLMGVLPHNVIAAGIHLRAKWYQRGHS